MKLTRAKLCTNRENARRSTGPTSPEGKAVASLNARSHGLLARSVALRSREDEAAFAELRIGLFDSWEPATFQEKMLVEEIVIDYWKLAILTRSIVAGLQRGEDRSVTRFIVSSLTGKSAPPAGDPTAQGADEISMGLVCEYVLMKVSKEDKDWADFTSTGSKHTKATQFEAKIGNAFHLALRYEGMVKRDLYKAIERLQELQKDRKRDNQTKPKP